MEDSESGKDSQWGNLPPDLILSIVGRISFPDVVRSRGISKQWSQVLSKRSSDLQSLSFPFLILSSEHGEQSESCTLLSLPESCCYHISPLPQICNRRFIGSNGNWLVTLNLALDPRLLNPFTRQEVPLPSLIAIPDPDYICMRVPLESISTWVGFYYDDAEKSPIPYPINLFRDLCIRKIVPSSDNDNGPPVVVLVSYGHRSVVRLALSRPGDCAWTLVPLPLSVKDDGVCDVVHNRKDGMFYAVTEKAVVLAFHPDNPEHVTMIFHPDNPEHVSEFHIYTRREKKYLVFSDDDLLLVERFQFRNISNKFRVYKINMQREGGGLTFSLLKHLSGRCLILGNNHSVSLSPEQVSGLKGNCIYFTDDYPDDLSRHYRDDPRDVGIFDLELGTFDRFLADYSSYNWPPPIWRLVFTGS